MNKTTLALLTAGISALAFAPSAQAGGYRYHSSSYDYCQPYRVRTCEVDRCTERRVAYDNCGYRYFYHVTVVTYRDIYSDGSTRTYTRAFRC